MIRFLLLSILILLLARTFWRVMDGVIAAAGGRARPVRPGALATSLARDPVCGTFVAPNTAVALAVGQVTRYFCSERCQYTFVRDGATHSGSQAS